MGLVDDIRQVNNEPGIFVITPTFNAEELENSYRMFTSLPIDRMRMSDDKALKLYGKTNVDMYNTLQTILNDRPVLEDFCDNGEAISIDEIDIALLERIKNPSPETIKVIDAGYNANDEVTVVIWPFTKYRPYTIDELKEMWAKYISLSAEGAERSDRFSYDYYNADVKTMYERNMNIIMNLTDRIFEPGEDHERFDPAKLKEDMIDNAYDRLLLEKERLNYIASAKYGNAYEAFAAKDGLDKIEKREQFLDDLTDEMPGFVPFLTPTEIEDYFDDGLTPDAKSFLEEYKKALAVGLCEFNGEEYKNHIENLFSQKDSKTHTIHIDEQLVSLGWNPVVKPTEKSWEFARKRIGRYINENYGFNIVDITNIDPIQEEAVESPFEPIYIVLSYTNTNIGKIITRVTDCKYSHSCIAFSEKLDPMYTYARGGLRFEVFENYLKKWENSICKVMVVFTTKKQLGRIKANLDYYISNREKTSYDVNNLFNILFHKNIKDEYSLKQVCSQFVNRMLMYGDINMFDKSNNLVTPSDFDKLKSPNIYTVYEGLVTKYNPKKVKNKINGICARYADKIRKNLNLREASDMLSSTYLIDDFFLAESGNLVVQSIIDNMRDLLTITPIAISEAKSLPFRINSKGIVIDLPVRLEEEYQEAHKTLQVYEKENKIEQMKPELARLWYLNLVAERKIRVKTHKGKTGDAKKIRDTRARIMNDFKKYLAVVLQNDKEFDFSSYFNTSKYNDRKLFVDKETLLYSGKAIATIIKTILKK